MEYAFDLKLTFIFAVMTLLLGKYLTGKIDVIRKYNIPEPVTGGMCVALIFFGLSQFGVSVVFDLAIRDMLLLWFFTTVALSAKGRMLLTGGKSFAILLTLAILYLFIQNIIGVGLASAMGIDRAMGMLGGSISLTGGHGTTLAWADVYKTEYGFAGAEIAGVGCATFGLVLGGVFGGPIGTMMVNKFKLKTNAPTAQLTVGLEDKDKDKNCINYNQLLLSLFVIIITIAVGYELDELLSYLGMKNLPLFISCMAVGLVLTNSYTKFFPRKPWPVGTPSMAVVSELSLNIFLAMSMMSLDLSQILDMAGPMLVIMATQLTAVVLFAYFIVFRLLGRDYDAAVISSGYIGLAMGATPTAIANMTAVTERKGPSPKAFIVIPLVGAFFVDFANAFIIQLFNHLFL